MTRVATTAAAALPASYESENFVQYEGEQETGWSAKKDEELRPKTAALTPSLRSTLQMCGQGLYRGCKDRIVCYQTVNSSVHTG